MDRAEEGSTTVYLSDIEEGRTYQLTDALCLDMRPPWGSIEIGAGTTFQGEFGDYQGNRICLGVKFNNGVNLSSRLFNVAEIPGVVEV